LHRRSLINGPALGPLHEASYVVVEDVPGEAWGYGGRKRAARQPEWSLEKRAL
jgi:phenylpyruvate tautomerase PptA (4-oxalocrotonate tautomerase family)